jgi:CRISPR-associated endoribonuclease Cas6
MRLQLYLSTMATSLPWEQVISPGRGVVYDLLARSAPELASRLHDHGWGPYGMVPLGYSPPVFPTASRRRGVYAVGGPGFLELGSPLPEAVEALARSLSESKVIDWGGVALRVEHVKVLEPPDFRSGHVRLRTATPVVMKGSGRDAQGVRTTRHAWLLPHEPEFASYFSQNLRRKAMTMGLSPDIELAAITWVGPRRSFAVRGGKRPGAPIEVELVGDPEALRAVWSWGLGQLNSAGFGWVIA